MELAVRLLMEKTGTCHYQWVLEMRNLHLPVHNAQIKQKAIKLIKPSHPSLKPSTGWLTQFQTRHSLVNRRHKSVQQKLPSQLEDKLRRCLEDLRALQIQHKFDKNLIIKMDETSMCFDMPSGTTVDVREKEVLF